MRITDNIIYYLQGISFIAAVNFVMLDTGLAADTCLWWSNGAIVILPFDFYHQQCLYLSRYSIAISVLFHAIFGVAAT